ncbi:MAG: hypothetical protein H0V44_10840 [Planctomycetes bacterium]|nr:hypothetical protein [Planctomycetota bacterium]
MDLHLLGTAAAEGWPAAYCDCPVCELARELGGPNIRMRTGALIDDDLKIDHSPDTIVHMQRARRSLAKVRAIVMTHEAPRPPVRIRTEAHGESRTGCAGAAPDSRLRQRTGAGEVAGRRQTADNPQFSSGAERRWRHTIGEADAATYSAAYR